MYLTFVTFTECVRVEKVKKIYKIWTNRRKSHDKNTKNKNMIFIIILTKHETMNVHHYKEIFANSILFFYFQLYLSVNRVCTVEKLREKVEIAGIS